VCGAAAALVGALAFAGYVAAAATDPDVLWKIVHDKCVPNQLQYARPAPCAVVDLDQGIGDGYVVLKDIRGATQYLVIPTARVTGIEDPYLLQPGAPNYFADAWRERGYTEGAAGRPLPRDAISLAVNSAFGRSQNQLHVHIDCIRPDIRDALRRQEPAIGAAWAPLPEPLLGHRYWAMRVLGDDLDGADPFRLLAAVIPDGAAMGEYTLVVAGAEFPGGQFRGGQPGFILLADRRDPAGGNRAHGEELQDHGCAIAMSEPRPHPARRSSPPGR
jgi:CDP-diacylglycerol pyrophosphatase